MPGFYSLGGGGGGGAAFELVVDESGAAITNWTSVAGTWAADAGGFIKQTDESVAYNGLRLTAPVAVGSALVMQADVRFPLSSVTDRRAMLGFGSSGVVGSTSDPWAGLQENTDAVIAQTGDQSALTAGGIVIDEDEWYTLRVERAAQNTTIYVDGVHEWSIGYVPYTSTAVASPYIILVSYKGVVHFRNVKVWRLAGPQ